MKRKPFTLLASVLLIALPAAAQAAKPAQETSKDAKPSDEFVAQPQGNSATKQDKDPLQSNRVDAPKEDTNTADPFQSSGGAGGFGGGGFPAGGGAYGGGGFSGGGAFGGGIPVTAQRMISGGNLIISWSEKNDQLRGFSLSDGSWTNLDIAPQRGLIPVVGDTVAAVKLQDGMAAFSAEKRRWDILSLAPSTKAQPVISNNLVTVHEGDHMYTFAASSGRWTSPTDPRFQMVTERLEMSGLPGIGSRSHQEIIENESKDLSLSVVVKGGMMEVSGPAHDLKTFKSRMKGAIQPDQRLPTASKAVPGTLNLDLGASPLTSRKNRKQSSSNTGLPLPGVATTIPQAPSSFFAPRYTDSSSIARFVAPYSSATFGTSKKEKATLDLAKKLKGKPVAETDRAKLKSLVASALDERLKGQQKSVEDLRKKLKAVEGKLEAKKENRDRIIERRVEELLNPDLDWEAAFNNGNSFQSADRLPALATGPASGFAPVGPRFQGRAFPEAAKVLPPAKSVPSPESSATPKRAPGVQPPSSLPRSPFDSSFPFTQPNPAASINGPSSLEGMANRLFQAKDEFGGQVRLIREHLIVLAEKFRAVQVAVKQRSQELEAGKASLLAAKKRADALPEDDVVGFVQPSVDSLTAQLQQKEASLQAVVSQSDITLDDWRSTWQSLIRLRELQAQRTAVAEESLEVHQSELKLSHRLLEVGAISSKGLKALNLEVSLAELRLKEIKNQLESMDDILQNRDDLKPPSSAKMKKPSTASKVDDGDLEPEAGTEEAKN